MGPSRPCPSGQVQVIALYLGETRQPIAQLGYGALRPRSVRVDILSGDVRDGCAIPIRITVQNQTRFHPLRSVTKALASKIQPEFEGHVEPRQVGSEAEADRRDIVNAVGALPYEAYDLVEPYLASIIDLKSATSDEAEIAHSKNDGVENGFVLIVERAVDKDVFRSEPNWHASHSVARIKSQALSDDGGHRLFDCLCTQTTLDRRRLNGTQSADVC